MKKLFILFTSSILFVCTAFAQQEVEAKAILDKAAQEIQKSTGSKSEFSLQISNSQTKETQTLNATLYLKGNKFKFLLPNTEMYYDGKTQWVYMPDANEVNISEPSKEELEMVNPTAILSSYTKGYKLNKEDDNIVDSKGVYVINIYPEDRNKHSKRRDENRGKSSIFISTTIHQAHYTNYQR